MTTTTALLTLPAAAVGIGWRHPHYGELLESAGGVAPWSARTPDFLEVHAENFFGAGGAALAVLTEARSHWPVSLHGVGLGLGSAVGVDDWHLERLAALVARVQPALISDHACFARGIIAPGTGAVHAADLLPLPFSHEALDVLCANVQHVQERLRRPILVENLSAYLDWSARSMEEPAFLGALVRRTGCKLLLDVNNLYVNELNRAIASGQLAAEPAKARLDAVEACRRWMDAVPPDAVAEIHLAGHCTMDDIVIDDHGSRVCGEVWQLHRHALDRFGPVPTLIEWDTDIPPLSVLLDEAARARAQTVEAAERRHDALAVASP